MIKNALMLHFPTRRLRTPLIRVTIGANEDNTDITSHHQTCQGQSLHTREPGKQLSSGVAAGTGGILKDVA